MYSTVITFALLMLQALLGHCTSLDFKKDASVDVSQFCATNMWNRTFEFISQYRPNEYLIFYSDNVFYRANFTGNNRFEPSPDGPYRVMDNFAGVGTIKDGLKFLLFVSPNESSSALMFMNEQVWLWTGPNNMIKVELAPECPTKIDNIINRSVQPHLLMDDNAQSYYNLTFDLATHKSTCSEPIQAWTFGHAVKMIGIDSPLSGFGTDPYNLFSMDLIEWFSNGFICAQQFSHDLLAFDRCPGKLVDKNLFCDNFQQGTSWRKTVLWTTLGVVIVLVVLIGAYFMYWLFKSSKNEMNDVLFNSQIE